MNDKFVSAFLDKLLMLEKSTGHFVHYKIMPPIQGTQDLLSIQRTAKNIASFVGIDNYVFNISYIKQTPKVGGIIELSHDGDMVFIEIDPSVTQHPQALYTTLCHEISHKWSHIHGVSASSSYDNEILTDITAVYLGFGKIMLNGCEETSKSDAKKKSSEVGKNPPIIFSVGYLDRDQLAFTYSLVCSMRKIPKEEILEGLTEASIKAIRTCHLNYGQYFQQEFHSPDYGNECLRRLRKRVTALQLRLAMLDKILYYLRRVLFEPLSQFYSKTHLALRNISRSADQKIQDTLTFDPALHYLNMVALSVDIDDNIVKMEEVENKAKELISFSSSLLYTFNRRNPVNSSEVHDSYVIVVCPIDETEIRLPKNSGDIIVKCPRCGYSFAYNTKPII